VLAGRLSILALGLCATSLAFTANAKSAARSAAEMDRDLMEVTIPQLHGYYAQHKYTVTQVVDWYLDRIAGTTASTGRSSRCSIATPGRCRARGCRGGHLDAWPVVGCAHRYQGNTSIQGR